MREIALYNLCFVQTLIFMIKLTKKNYGKVIFLSYSCNFVYLVGSYDLCYDLTICAFLKPKRYLVKSRVCQPWFQILQSVASNFLLAEFILTILSGIQLYYRNSFQQ